MFLDLYNNRSPVTLKSLIIGSCFYFYGEPTLYLVCDLVDGLCLRNDNVGANFDTCLILDLTSHLISECDVTKMVVPLRVKCVRVEGVY